MKLEKRKRKDGWRYRARISVNYTMLMSPWLRSADEAQDWAAEKRMAIKAGQVNTGAEISVTDFAKLWLEKHAYTNKVKSAAIRDEHALKLVLPVLGAKKLRQVTSVQIEFLFSDLRRAGKQSPKTLNNYLGTVKKMLGDAVRWGYLNFNPADRVPPTKVPRQEVTYLYREEVARLLAFTASCYPSEHELFVFALNTGCRLGECLGLDWRKVDLERRFAKIDATYDSAEGKIVARTKGKRFRMVPLNEPATALLRRMKLEGRANESSTAFSRVDYKYLSTERFKLIMTKAGLTEALQRKATFHSLRHTFASEFMRTGGNLFELQHVLGHSTIQQTERYAHFAPDFLAGVTERVAFGAAALDNLRALVR